MKNDKTLSLDAIIKDITRLKNDFDELLNTPPKNLTYGLIEITEESYPDLAEFIELTANMYNSMFQETNLDKPCAYICNHDFAKGWFDIHPQGIKEKLEMYGLDTQHVRIIEETKNEFGRPAIFLSSNNKTPEEILWTIVHETGHWADYKFLGSEGFLKLDDKIEEIGDTSNKFMHKFRIELPGEILNQQCIKKISEVNPNIGEAINSCASDIKKVWQKLDSRIYANLGYSVTKIVKDSDFFMDFLKKAEDYIPLTQPLKKIFESREVLKELEDSPDCLTDHCSAKGTQRIYSKKKILSKLKERMPKKDFINKTNEKLDTLNKQYQKQLFRDTVTVIEYLMPHNFVLTEENVKSMKKGFDEWDCYNLVKAIYKSKR